MTRDELLRVIRDKARLLALNVLTQVALVADHLDVGALRAVATLTDNPDDQLMADLAAEVASERGKGSESD